MPSQLIVQSLAIEAIQDTCTWNVHPYLDNIIPDSLEKSISEVGILHPPVLMQTRIKTYDVVCGRKRIRCSQRLGAPTILCRILPPGTPPKMVLRFLLEDQMSGLPLTLPELAHFFRISLKYLQEDEALAMLPVKNLPGMHARQLRILLELDDGIQRMLHSGQMTDKIIYDLVQLDRADRDEIVYLVWLLQLGGNKQKRLMTLCRDITLRENIPLGSLLDQPDIKTVLEHKEMNIPQKTSRLFDLLQKRCYPKSSAAREAFQSQVHELALPESCDICPSPFFEKDEVTLSLRFPDLEACRKAWSAIQGHLNSEKTVHGKKNQVV